MEIRWEREIDVAFFDGSRNPIGGDRPLAVADDTQFQPIEVEMGFDSTERRAKETADLEKERLAVTKRIVDVVDVEVVEVVVAIHGILFSLSYLQRMDI